MSVDMRSIFVMPDIFEKDFWCDMRQALFGEESIPAELEVVGEKIVHNCGCRYVSAAKTLVFLPKVDKTVEEWSNIVEDTKNPIFLVADEISEVPSSTRIYKLNQFYGYCIFLMT